jgi:hypothetical protein
MACSGKTSLHLVAVLERQAALGMQVALERVVSLLFSASQEKLMSALLRTGCLVLLPFSPPAPESR